MKYYEKLIKAVIARQDNRTGRVSYDSEELINEVLEELNSGYKLDQKVLVWLDKNGFIKDYEIDDTANAKDEEELNVYKDAIQSFLENKDVKDILEIKLIDLYTILKLQDSIFSNYKLIPFEQFERQRQNKSKAGKASWSKLSPEERSKIAKERGRAGALKRWNKK